MKKINHIHISIDKKLCKGVDGCGLCIHVCPKEVYKISDSLTDKGIKPPEPVNIDQCSGCMLCMMYCPDFSIVVDVEK